MVATNSTKKYLLFPNEPVDKLSVNRPLNNLYEVLSDIGSTSGVFTVSNATTSEYGLVRESAETTYCSTDTGNADYSDNAMMIAALRDFASKQSSVESVSKYAYYGSDSDDYKYCLRLNSGECDFMQMPNGVTVLSLTFDFAVHDLPVMFGSEVYSGSVDTPMGLSGYGTQLVYDDTSRSTLEYFRGDGDTCALTGLFDNLTIDYDYPIAVDGTVHLNDCNWKSYSSFRQSYVETTFSFELGVLDLYDVIYGYSSSRNYKDGGESATDEEDDGIVTKTPYPNARRPFSEKPVIVLQNAMYNNDSRPVVAVGTYDKDDSTGSFDDTDAVTESVLSVESIGDSVGGESVELSQASGVAMLKGYENEYTKSGKIKDNKIKIDVALKFFAGSADDPSMARTIRNINAKSCLQVLLIGV